MNVKTLIAATTWHPGLNWQQNVPTEISVLLPTFCRAQSGLFLRAVRSVLQQRNINLELIIVDDASVDGTAEQIAAFMREDPRVSCLKHPVNIGLPAISEFEAYGYARGKFIAFAFDDDEFLPDALAQLLAGALANNAKCVYGHVDIYVPDVTTQKPAVLANFGRSGAPQTLFHSHNFISNNAVLVHRDVLEDVGLYDPHIAIARLCDLDLWCRIAQKYDVLAVDVAVGRIDGPMRDDSLGNTYGIELWLANEWMHIPRNEALRPASFGDYDVLSCPETLSIESTNAVAAIETKFNTKKWYKDACRLPNLGYLQAYSDANMQGSIGLIVTAYDASITLCFDRLPAALRARVRVMLYQHWQVTFPEELMGASALIFARDLFGLSDAIAHAQALNIPHYYFIDDNFVALGQLPEHAAHYGRYTTTAVAKALQSFEGVLASTPALQVYFEVEKLHANVMLLPPMVGQSLRRQALIATEEASAVATADATNDGLKLAFIGGAHRIDAFIKFVLPAIAQFSTTSSAINPITLYLAGDKNNVAFAQLRDALSPFAQRVKLIVTAFNYDLESLLRHLAANSVDALLHPGEQHENSQYKTLNVLLNANQIGAVPILSAVAPYIDIAQSGVAHVVENNSTAWLAALESCMSAKKLGQQTLLQNLHKFCAHEFSGATNTALIAQLVSAHSPASQIVRDARFRQAISLQKAENRRLQAQLHSRRFVVKRAIRMLIDAALTKLRLR